MNQKDAPAAGLADDDSEGARVSRPVCLFSSCSSLSSAPSDRAFALEYYWTCDYWKLLAATGQRSRAWVSFPPKVDHYDETGFDVSFIRRLYCQYAKMQPQLGMIESDAGAW